MVSSVRFCGLKSPHWGEFGCCHPDELGLSLSHWWAWFHWRSRLWSHWADEAAVDEWPVVECHTFGREAWVPLPDPFVAGSSVAWCACQCHHWPAPACTGTAVYRLERYRRRRTRLVTKVPTVRKGRGLLHYSCKFSCMAVEPAEIAQRVDTINSPQLKYRSRLLIADCANFCNLHFCKITRLFRFRYQDYKFLF